MTGYIEDYIFGLEDQLNDLREKHEDLKEIVRILAGRVLMSDLNVDEQIKIERFIKS